MGIQTSKLRCDEVLYTELWKNIYNYRVHTIILIVGEKGAGKTSLVARINKILGACKSWVHTFDTETTDDVTSKTTTRSSYDNGVNVEGLSILETTLPLHGIIWVMDARKMNGIEDCDRAKNILSHLRNLQGCETSLFFSHMDLATRSNLEYIKGLYLEDPSIPNSGEFSESRISYAPLVISSDRDADHTILGMVKLATDWSFSSSRRTVM